MLSMPPFNKTGISFYQELLTTQIQRYSSENNYLKKIPSEIGLIRGLKELNLGEWKICTEVEETVGETNLAYVFQL